MVRKLPLSETHPDVAVQAHGWDPKLVTSGSGGRFAWKCNLGHVWETTISSRVHSESACPYCANKKVLPGFNDLSHLFPDIAKEADGWDPKLVSPGTKKKYAFKCIHGHKWVTSVYLRTVRGLGCPYCSGQKILRGFNDLDSVSPDIATQADGWDPTKYFWASTKVLPWVCELGHKWSTSVKHRTKSASGCPVCSGRTTVPGFNDLATKHPDLSLEATDWNPSEYSSSSQKIVEWKCREGHLWKARISNRAYLNRGCPTCSKTGFDPNEQGWLYLLRHEAWGLTQIGISNVIEKRLQTHINLGWEVIDLRGPTDGMNIYGWEQDILKYLKQNGAEFRAEEIAGKFTGFTESWIEESFPIDSLSTLFRSVNSLDEN